MARSKQGTGQDIVLNPADNYIERFVKEVNRGRVLRVDSVLRPTGSALARPRICVPTGTTLETATRALMDARERELGVIDEAGHCIGVVTLDAILATTFGASEEAHAERARCATAQTPLVGGVVKLASR